MPTSFGKERFFFVSVLVFLLVLVPVIAFAAGAAEAPEYPTRRITVVQPWAAGGPAHVVSQLVADQLTEQLGQRVTVANVTGAGGVSSIMHTLDQPADGYTILDGWGSPLSTVPLLRDVDYDSVNDFIPLWGVFVNPLIVAIREGETRFTNMEELLEYGRNNPGLRYSPGPGHSLNHFIMALLLKDADVKARAVPYPGNVAAVPDLLAGVLDFAIVNPGIMRAHEADLKAIACLSDERPLLHPDVPSVEEFGYWSAGPYGDIWQYYLVPKDTPQEVVEILRDAFENIANDEAFRQRLIEMGNTPAMNPPERYEDFITGTADVAKQGMEAVEWEESHRF